MDSPAAVPPKKEDALPTVNDLLSFDNMSIHDKKVEMPGKNVSVPEDLLKSAGPSKPVQAAEEKKKPAPAALPDELPPLPDLEDDKGII